MRKKNFWLLASILSVVYFFAGCSEEIKDIAPVNTEKPYEAVMAYSIFEEIPEDLQLVEDEINKITVPEINVKVKLTPLSGASYRQQINLMLSGNGKIDLFSVFGDSFGEYVSKDQLLFLNDLIERYGQKIKAMLPQEYRGAGTVNGKLYAVTTVTDPGTPYGALLRKDLLDKYDIDISNVKSLEDFEGILKVMKNYEPDLSLVVPSAQWESVLRGDFTIDWLGDGIGVLQDYGKELKVVNQYESQQYLDLLHLIRRWYDSGYIMKNAAINRENLTDLFKANKAFSALTTIFPGLAEINSKVSGKALVAVTFTEPFISTRELQDIQWGIAANSENPEKVMQLLNLLYYNQEINNLLSWGIKDKHYVETTQKGIIDYPQGINYTNTGYNQNVYWLFPNPFPAYVWKGGTPKFYKQKKEYSQKAVRSKALGFVFDSAPVKTELSAVKNIINQYIIPLESGIVDPDRVMPEFNAKLKAAGIDKIIAEKQRQLDSWAKANNIR
jgi:putative aldouronate transport system substrate-binding protein